MTSLRYTLPTFAFLLIVGVFFWRLHQTAEGDTPNRIASILIDKPTPAFDLPPLYPGKPGLKSADLKGHVTLVNFFASWCVPCRAEHPMLGRIARNGITLVGIAYKDKPDAARTYLAELGNPYGRVATDAYGHAGLDFGVSGVPESYLVDSNGIIRFTWPGPITEDVLNNEILPRAEKILPHAAKLK